MLNPLYVGIVSFYAILKPCKDKLYHYFYLPVEATNIVKLHSQPKAELGFALFQADCMLVL